MSLNFYDQSPSCMCMIFRGWGLSNLAACFQNIFLPHKDMMVILLCLLGSYAEWYTCL